jgi:hypothetical protein
MPDFSATSTLSIVDSSAGESIVTAQVGSPLATTISDIGTAVTVEAVLRDKSGNEKASSIAIEKLKYLSSDEPVEYFSAQANESIDFLIKVNGAAAPDEIIFAINRLDGGYRLATANATLFESISGEIIQLQNSGTGLAAHILQQGEHRLLFFAFDNGSINQPISAPLFGQLIASAGNTLWVSHGELISAYTATATDFVSVLGKGVSQTIVASQVSGKDILVLSDDGITRLSVEISNTPRISQTSFVALPNQLGFVVNGAEIVSWSSDQIQRHELQADGSLIAIAGQDTPLSGNVRGYSIDGELVWLKLGDQFGARWQAYLAGELVGVLKSEDVGDDRSFTSNRAYLLSRSGDVDSVSVRVINSADPTPSAPSMVVSLEQAIFGVELLIDYNDDPFGLTGVYAKDDNGRLLATSAIWRNGQSGIFISYPELAGATSIVVTGEAHAGALSEVIALDSTNNTVLDSTAPLGGAVLTQNALIPVLVKYPSGARINAHSFTSSATQVALASASQSGYRWLQLGDSVIANVDIAVNGSVQSQSQLNLVENNLADTSTLLINPVNNQSFKEGELIEVEYSSTTSSLEPFQYSQVSIFDFNRNLISEIISAEANGKLRMRLPVVNQLDTFFLRVRSYYGDQFVYSEAEIGLRIAPQLQVPAPILSGALSQVFVGSELNLELSLALADSQFDTRLEIFDDQGILLASDPTQLTIIAPPGTNFLTVRGTVSDDFGNSRDLEQSIAVVAAITPSLSQASGLEFDHLLPDTGNAWLTRGRLLVDQNNLQIAELDSEITAIARLTDRLVLALADRRLVIVDPAEAYQVVGTLQQQQIIEKLVVYGNKLIAIDDLGQVHAFTSSGNEILATNFIGLVRMGLLWMC